MEIEANMYGLICESDRLDYDQAKAALIENKVPEELARRIAGLSHLVSSLDIVRIASKAGIKVVDAAAVYYAVGEAFCLDWLREGARRLIGDSHWDRLAVFAIIDDLYGHQRELTAAVLAAEAKAEGVQALAGKPLGEKPAQAKQAIGNWRAGRGVPVQRVDQLLADLRQVGKIELSMLAVANRGLRSVME
jgi:glutamate dehydrogenase